MTTLNLQVTQSSDDAFEGATGTVTLSGTQIGAINSAGQWAGVRFQNVTVPNGATITSATLELFVATADDPIVDIYGEDTDDAATFTTANNNVSSRTLTTAKYTWSGTNIGASQWHSLPVTSIVAEIVARGGWASGNDMAFIIDCTSASSNVTFRPWDYDDHSLAPKLTIEYSTGPAMPVLSHYYRQLAG